MKRGYDDLALIWFGLRQNSSEASVKISDLELVWFGKIWFGLV